MKKFFCIAALIFFFFLALGCHNAKKHDKIPPNYDDTVESIGIRKLFVTTSGSNEIISNHL